MRLLLSVMATLVVIAMPQATAAQSSTTLDQLVRSATKYVETYEAAFSLLVSEERYVQDIHRPVNAGTNLSRANPGGGMQAGGTVKRQVLRSDYLLVQLGEGSGWMPFRDVFEVNASKIRDREDRLAKLFLSNDAGRFEQADRIMAESTRYNLGNVTRTINIPTLGMMFLHPRVRERFAFQSGGEESLDGRLVHRVTYREVARPTLIKTTRGTDLLLQGEIWIEPSTGAVVKTTLTASDPLVRAVVTVTFRQDPGLEIWVPLQMEEYYKAANSLDEIITTATYSNVRRFQVNTNEKITKPPGW